MSGDVEMKRSVGTSGTGSATAASGCAGAAPASPGDLTCDVLIVGCGVAGLYAALNLPRDRRVIMLAKSAVDECDSMLAQGGICVLPDADDYDAYVEDTMRAGHYECRAESVDIMVRSSRAIINDLVALGVDFERTPDGSLAFTREGAHSRPRICYRADITGREITTKLLEQVRHLPNVRMLAYTAMVDLLLEDGACAGVRARRVTPTRSTDTAEELRTAQEGVSEPFDIRATDTLLACGGIGGTYERSTNFPQLTGDACALAREHGIELEHPEYVQIHPTGLYSHAPGRTFLISESCRGEGAILINAAGERFTDELQPRDVVTEAICAQMRIDGTDHERLSFAPVDPAVICEHFANIRAHCLDVEGIDILHEPIPVVPTQHYFMGGVHVDRDSATAVPHLYAAGETSCNGVHGKNRLASNSLLESLVFARRAAYRMATGASLPVERVGEPALDGRHRRCGSPDAAIDALCADGGRSDACVLRDAASAVPGAPSSCPQPDGGAIAGTGTSDAGVPSCS